nr:hypothetical protein [Rectinema sp.]
MGKNASIPPQGRKHEDLLEGLFISPLDDSESLQKMEAEEMKILSPLEGTAHLEGSSANLFNSSEEKCVFPPDSMHESEKPEISTKKKPNRTESLAQEQLL